MTKFTNDLINESSPYLLQHAHNPVNWKPWSEEALAQAEEENKLIVVSIGYAACHWCHVMEHESFEDMEVADFMNKHYVSIKVDREERPDIDQVYMDAAHLITGRGGWPLNVITLPDGRPIYAGTYFTKQQWLKVLKGVNDFNRKTPEQALEQAMQIATGVSKMNYIPATGQEEFSKNIISAGVADWVASLDMKEGGRAGQMKFPMPKAYLALLNYGVEFKEERAVDMVKLTLDKMASGGIYDQLGGGFSRYSVDPHWHVPHFEKMLYDNAQLIELYSEAYKLTKDAFYKQVVAETIAFCQRELGAPEDAFYASLDADSEGEEGKFYAWQSKEIVDCLGDQAKVFMDFYGVREDGNWENGSNVLKMSMSVEDITTKYDLSVNQFSTLLRQARKTLLSKREERIRPALDDKVLTSWNALMITGLTRAYEAFGESAYRQMAENTGEFIWQQMWDGTNLFRSRKNGKSTITGFIDDYAFTIAAFLDLYQISFNISWIDRAEILLQTCMDLYFNKESGFFEFKSKMDASLFVKKSVLEDNVIPAGNSEMGINLFRIGHLLDNKEYLQLSDTMLSKVSKNIREHAAFYYNWLDLYRLKITNHAEVVILGDDFDEVRKKFVGDFMPSVILLGGKKETRLPLTVGKTTKKGTMLYVCVDKTCQLPTEDVLQALDQVRKVQ